jgi:hypothetical protein
LRGDASVVQAELLPGLRDNLPFHALPIARRGPDLLGEVPRENDRQILVPGVFRVQDQVAEGEAEARLGRARSPSRRRQFRVDGVLLCVQLEEPHLDAFQEGEAHHRARVPLLVILLQERLGHHQALQRVLRLALAAGAQQIAIHACHTAWRRLGVSKYAHSPTFTLNSSIV